MALQESGGGGDGNRADPWVRRFALDGGRAVVAGAVLVLTAIAVADPPARWEASVFRAINDLPHELEEAMWVFQQAGSALVIPVAAVGLWRLANHWRPPVALLVGSFFLGWLATKGMKALTERGRPSALFDDVQRGYGAPVEGVGFPSGHAVLAFTLAVVFSPYVGRRLRWLLYALAALVLVLRIYVGAHMPLDVIGGAAYGAVVGSVVNLGLGIRVPSPSDPAATPRTL